MAQRGLLTHDLREFLQRLAEFVFGNPFSPEREHLLTELMPGVPLHELRGNPAALSHVVADRMAQLDRERAARLSDFAPADRPLLETAILYFAYHRHLDSFDRLIERQLASASNPDVAFAEALVAELGARGFEDDDSVRYLAIFYQLRRAYYFIVRSLPGTSPCMQQLRRALWNSVFTHDMRGYNRYLWNRMEDFSTLLLGETGTGKGNAAAAIGRSAFIPFLREQRRFASNFTQTFISLNLSQFPETLIESELFGHRKGAFTGAIDNHEGVLELCSEHGALFLDEIGEVSVPVQIKLLQVLQERIFTPLGSHAQKRFKGRVIAATNRPLTELRGGGRFRDDFFYRLCSDVIEVPPLRQRVEESPAELEELVALLVARMTGSESGDLTAMILDALHRDLPPAYPWPGNVRELEQAVRRILLAGRYAGNLAATSASADALLVESVQEARLNAAELLGQYCAMLYRRFGTYAAVADRTGLDRRTARKYVVEYSESGNGRSGHAPRESA